jgi:hypothetical protein
MSSCARALALLTLLFLGGAARGDEPTTATVIATAQAELQQGHYETVVALLRPIVDGNQIGPGWFEALRAYGIACAMTQRRASAEGAFALMLEQPAVRGTPQPAAALFDHVRARFVAAETAVTPRHHLSREAVVGTVLVSLGAATALAGLVLDGTALEDQLNQTGSQWRFNGQLGAIVLSGASLTLGVTGIALLVHGARPR